METVVICSAIELKAGYRFDSHNIFNKKINSQMPSGNPCIVLKVATIEEYIEFCKQDGLPDSFTFVNDFYKYFYHISTD